MYENNQWIVRDNVLNKIVLLSPTDAFCPEMVMDNEWIYYDFERDIYDQDQERVLYRLKRGFSLWKVKNVRLSR